MDPGTASVIVAGMTLAGTLVTLGVNVLVLGRVRETHSLVNGLAHEKTALLEAAALKEGELRGRDFTPPPTEPHAK